MSKQKFNYQKYFVNKAKMMKARRATVQSEKDNISLTKACASGDLETMPLATICAGIQLLMNELIKRGKPIKDFDHKEKAVEQIQIIGGDVYFLAKEYEGYEESKEKCEGV